MPFWKCYYHIIWTTKHRRSIITSEIEAVLFPAIRSKSDELHSPILAVNGIEDHVHVAVCIRPSLSVSDWVGQIKGTSSRTVNRTFSDLDTKFQWQNDYGVLTFGAKNMQFVLSYIENQKAHHQSGALQPYLEQIED